MAKLKYPDAAARIAEGDEEEKESEDEETEEDEEEDEEEDDNTSGDCYCKECKEDLDECPNCGADFKEDDDVLCWASMHYCCPECMAEDLAVETTVVKRKND